MPNSNSSAAKLRWHSQNSTDVEGADVGANRLYFYSNAQKLARWQGLKVVRMASRAGRFVARGVTRTFRPLTEVSNTG